MQSRGGIERESGKVKVEMTFYLLLLLFLIGEKIHANGRITIWCSDHKIRLNEVIEPGRFLYFLEKEAINLWEIDRSKETRAH